MVLPRQWRGCMIVTCVVLALMLGLVFSFPANTDTDTENLVIYARSLAAGKVLPVEALTTVKPLACLLAWFAHDVCGGVRSIQILGAVVFAVFCALVYKIADEMAGPISGLLAIWALVTSPKDLSYVMWGRSPVLGYTFIVAGMLLFVRYPDTGCVDSNRRVIPTRCFHGVMFFSMLAILSRTDLIFSHMCLVALFVGILVFRRSFCAAVSIFPWTLVVLTPFLADYLFARDWLFTKHTTERWLDATKTGLLVASWSPAGIVAMARSFCVAVWRHLGNDGSILYPLSIVLFPLGVIVIFRKNRILAGMFVAALSGSIMLWLSTYLVLARAERLFAVPRVLLTILAAIGGGWLLGLCPLRKLRYAIAVGLGVLMMVLNVQTYRRFAEGVNKMAARYERHVGMANLMAKNSMGRYKPFVVQDSVTAFIYMNRLRLFHLDVYNEREIKRRLRNGELLPSYKSYIRSLSASPFGGRPDMVPSNMVLEHNGIRLFSHALNAQEER